MQELIQPRHGLLTWPRDMSPADIALSYAHGPERCSELPRTAAMCLMRSMDEPPRHSCELYHQGTDTAISCIADPVPSACCYPLWQAWMDMVLEAMCHGLPMQRLARACRPDTALTCTTLTQP